MIKESWRRVGFFLLVAISAGSVYAENIYGTPGDDVIRGTAGSDYISSGSGNDWVWSGPGSDYISEGAGDDTLLGGEGEDLVRGGGGADQINPGMGDEVDTVDAVDGVEGNDRILAGPEDIIEADDGDWVTIFDHEGGMEIFVGNFHRYKIWKQLRR